MMQGRSSRGRIHSITRGLGLVKSVERYEQLLPGPLFPVAISHASCDSLEPMEERGTAAVGGQAEVGFHKDILHELFANGGVAAEPPHLRCHLRFISFDEAFIGPPVTSKGSFDVCAILILQSHPAPTFLVRNTDRNSLPQPPDRFNRNPNWAILATASIHNLSACGK